MSRKPPTEKSSSKVLWTALLQERRESERWRRLARKEDPAAAAETDDTIAVSRAEWEGAVREADAERTRARAALEELADARSEAKAQGVAGGRFVGKPALSDLASAWRRFTTATLNLPSVRKNEGMAGVHLAVSTRMIFDLYLLGLTAPRNEAEARDRDRIRRMLDHPVFRRLISRREEWARRLRVVFLQATARAYVRSSIHAIYERAAEQGTLDELGTVVK